MVAIIGKLGKFMGLDKERYSSKEAAYFLGISDSTLRSWRRRKMNGLRYRKVGKKIIYTIKELESFLEKSERE